jgi:hypothetical protein
MDTMAAPNGGVEELMTDLVVGGAFPDLALPDHTGTVVRLSEITRGQDPLAVIFYRGWY